MFYLAYFWVLPILIKFCLHCFPHPVNLRGEMLKSLIPYACSFNFQESNLDLHLLYEEVTQRGGFYQVSNAFIQNILNFVYAYFTILMMRFLDFFSGHWSWEVGWSRVGLETQKQQLHFTSSTSESLWNSASSVWAGVQQKHWWSEQFPRQKFSRWKMFISITARRSRVLKTSTLLTSVLTFFFS